MTRRVAMAEREAAHAAEAARTGRSHGAGAALVAVGCACVIVALALVAGRFAFAQAKQAESARTCEAIAAAWDAAVPAADTDAGSVGVAGTAGAGGASAAGAGFGGASGAGANGTQDASAFANLPALQVASTDVVGRLTCDAAGIDVPVAAYGADAAVVPTREPKADGDAAKLVVHGAAYQADGAFGRIGQLETGARIVFQRADGSASAYDVVAKGTMNEQFTDHFDLLMYYENERGQRVWAGCSKVS